MSSLMTPKFRTGTNSNLNLAGCVFYAPLWRPDLGGSTFYDIDGHNLCTVTGALWTPTGRSFDGIDDVIIISWQPVIATGTLIFWLKATNWTSSPIVVNKVDSTANGYIQYTGGTLNFYAPGDVLTTNWGNPSVGVYHQVALVVNGTNHTVYLDGIQVGSPVASALGMFDGAVNLQFGKFRGSENVFAGSIGEVLIYNRALSGGEIQQNHLATKWRYN